MSQTKAELVNGLSVNTALADAITVNSSGQVGIGDDSPDREFIVKKASSNASIKIEASNAHTSQLFFSDTDTENVARISVFHGSGSDQNSLLFGTAGTARLAITSSGEVGIGTITPLSYAGATILNNNGLALQGSSQSRLLFRHDNGGTNNKLMDLAFDEGRIKIRQIEDNTTTAHEHFRFRSDGMFCVSVDGGTEIAKQGTADTHDGLTIDANGELQVCRTSNTTCFFNRNGSGGNIVDFRYGGSSVGNISNTGNSLPSDRNYKKNITNLTLGLNLVNKLQPVSYQYKFSNDSDPVMYGLVAQDFETALNDVGVAQNKAAILQYEDKKDEKQSDYNLDYTKLTPILINAVKELSAKVTTLETKVAALEAA